MEQFLRGAVWVVLLAAGSGARAQTSLQVIQQDMQQVKQQHDEANSQLMTTFLAGLQQASSSPATALDLYQKAGGSLPDASPVKSHYEYETPTERTQRESIDMQNYRTVAALIQIHCGLMRQAALLTINPKAPEVQAQWLMWLKAIAQQYPQLIGNAPLKTVTMRNSVIGKYFGFRAWGGSPQGNWAVSNLPELYRSLVLEPLRLHATQDTLDAWDTYIAMRQADEPDHDKWTQEEEPELAFERASDDFNIEPTMDKLTTLDTIIKGNPTSDHLDDWLKRMQAMIAIYQGGGTNHTPLPGETPATPPSEAAGTTPVATPGSSSSEAPGVTPAATPGTTPVNGASVLPSATPGTSSSEAAGPLPAATPGSTPGAAPGQLPTATPGIPSSSAAAGTLPGATPGTPSAGSGSPLPTASPGTPSAAAPGPIPAATPGTPTSGTTAAP